MVSFYIWDISGREGAIMMHWFLLYILKKNIKYIYAIYIYIYIYLFAYMTRPEGPAVQQLEPSKATIASGV